MIEDDVDGPGVRQSGEAAPRRGRLLDGHSPAARALAAYDTRVGGGESDGAAELRAWRAVSGRLEAAGTGSARARRWRWLVPGAAVAGVAAAVVLVVTGRLATDDRGTAPSPVATVPPAARPVSPAVPAPAPAVPEIPETRIALGRTARPLATGRNLLEAEAVVTIAGEARAEAHVDRPGRAKGNRSSRVAVTLRSGAVDLEVSPRRKGGRQFAVVAGPYQFVVLGTVFRVERDGRATVLSVREGRVAVWQRGRRVATVGAGGTWSGAPEPVAGLATTSVGLVPCGRLAERRRWQSALDCYRAAGDRGQTLEAETAHYEAARVQREKLGDDEGAARTLAAYRRQFPRGSLRAEVDLTFVELLPRLGRHREALAESAALLREGRHERAAELRLLRGNILREVFRDHPAADREYREAAALAAGRGARPGVADDAAFFHAVCLEASGQRAEAAAAYRDYLRIPGGAHGGEASARAGRLAP